MKSIHPITITLYVKGLFLVILISFGMMINMYGQNWKTTGNNISPSEFLGTTNHRDLKLLTDNIQRMVITANGNIGLGTPNPTSLLSVGALSEFRINESGNIRRINDVPYSFPAIQGGVGTVLTNNGSGTLTWSAGVPGPAGPQGETGATGPMGPAGPPGQNGSSNGWLLTGNAGTIDGTHFLGTTDDVPLSFRVNNEKAGRIEIYWQNTFYGMRAGNMQTFAIGNTAIGYEALMLNSDGFYNSAFGVGALKNNTTGNDNTGHGVLSLNANTTGSQNIAFGGLTLQSNTTGNYNTACGLSALSQNTTGGNNTAVGNHALYLSKIGSYNTAIGYDAFYFEEEFTNSTAIGHSAQVSGSNMARVGDANVTSIGGWANWTNVSDARFKKDISEKIPGLDFITKLRPVSYHLDMDAIASLRNIPDSMRFPKSELEKSNILQTGFIAQEVDKAAQEIGFDFSGVDKPKNDKDFYGLRYAEFVVPLVKAVQEQQVIIEDQNARATYLQNEVDELKSMLEKLSLQVAALQGNSDGLPNPLDQKTQNQTIVLAGPAYLKQNTPNPFTNETTIEYFIPESLICGDANCLIVFYDQTGRIIRETIIKEPGSGSILVSADNLPGGVFTYTLLVNGKMIDSKKMAYSK